MASKATTIADEDGDFVDWIELYNFGSEPVGLEGYGCSNSYDKPFKWIFPATTIYPGQHNQGPDYGFLLNTVEYSVGGSAYQC